MKQRAIPVILTAALTSLVTMFCAVRFQQNIPFLSTASTHQLPVNTFHYAGGPDKAPIASVDFQNAAEASVKAVVHIKTSIKARTVSSQDFGDDMFSDPFAQMFGRRQFTIPQQMGSGSGVVVSPDGYIVTNNHVVAGAEKLTVTFNDRYTTEATVVATDPSTDIALIKVTEKNLPYMEIGNSEDVHLGQWVLAVGYPLSLDATVTAGIVSAKGRSIGINRSQSASAIESFIQTDAAVNPGNSGGALVNTSGQLIGINSAIASPTGSYAGYSYAIPSNIVKKVVNDLMKYGTVQRAYLGINIMDRKSASPEKLKELQLDKNDGVYVVDVVPNGGAAKSGIQKGDFITAINNVAVHTEPELLEQIASYKPGDNVSISYTRAGASKMASVELRNIRGNSAVVKENAQGRLLGASLRNLTSDEKSKYGVKGGVVITDPGTGTLAKQTMIKKNFVVTIVNDQEVSSVDDIQQAIAANGNKAQIAGFYPGGKGMYYFGLNNLNSSTMEE